MSGKSYIDHIFTGVRSFTSFIEETEAEYEIIDFPERGNLYALEDDLLREGKDTLVLGKCSNYEGRTFFFLQFGISLEDQILTHMTFIYDHRPNLKEMEEAAFDIGPLTVEKLQDIKNIPSTPDNSTIQ